MIPIKTALCSFGMSGSVFHAPFVNLHPGFDLYAVFERTKNLAREKYPGINTFRSLPEMLDDEDIELVVVNTPNSTHYQYAMLALEAGKHVVVEKPFTLTPKEAKTLKKTANKKDRKLTVYQNRRWDSDFMTVQDIVRKGVLGNIIQAEIHFDRFKPQLGVKVHKETPGPGAGLLYDLGPHLIDQALLLFGMPEKLFADVRIVRPFSEVEDYFDLYLFYKTLRVRLTASYLVKEKLPAYILHGTKGSFIKPRADVQEVDLQSGRSLSENDWGNEPEQGQGLLHSETGGDITRSFIPSFRGNYMKFYEMLYHAIRTNGILPVTADEAIDVMLIIKAAYKSVSLQKIIKIKKNDPGISNSCPVDQNK